MTSASFLAFCASLQLVSRTNDVLPMHGTRYAVCSSISVFRHRAITCPASRKGGRRHCFFIDDDQAEAYMLRAYAQGDSRAENWIRSKEQYRSKLRKDELARLKQAEKDRIHGATWVQELVERHGVELQDSRGQDRRKSIESIEEHRRELRERISSTEYDF